MTMSPFGGGLLDPILKKNHGHAINGRTSKGWWEAGMVESIMIATKDTRAQDGQWRCEGWSTTPGQVEDC